MVGPNGEHVGPDGTSRSLGGQEDREWFLTLRRRADVILTSGKTFLDEAYRKPQGAALAVFSRQIRHLDLPEGTIALGSAQAKDFREALGHLRLLGYRKIHCEFGPTGFLALSEDNIVESYLSSESQSGIEAFTERNDTPFSLVASGSLFIARIGSVAVH